MLKDVIFLLMLMEFIPADPNIVKNAKKIEKISYEEMLEMSSMGAKVLHTRSVELAMKNNLTLQVLSSLTGKEGTLYC